MKSIVLEWYIYMFIYLMWFVALPFWKKYFSIWIVVGGHLIRPMWISFQSDCQFNWYLNLKCGKYFRFICFAKVQVWWKTFYLTIRKNDEDEHRHRELELKPTELSNKNVYCEKFMTRFWEDLANSLQHLTKYTIIAIYRALHWHA